jgi:hypothetical protein
VCDNRDVIYAYGPPSRYRIVLGTLGLVEMDFQVPDPHQRHFSEEYYAEEDRLMGYWAWLWFPLKEYDDQ